jgi:hypothetical protein
VGGYSIGGSQEGFVERATAVHNARDFASDQRNVFISNVNATARNYLLEEAASFNSADARATISGAAAATAHTTSNLSTDEAWRGISTQPPSSENGPRNNHLSRSRPPSRNGEEIVSSMREQPQVVHTAEPLSPSLTRSRPIVSRFGTRQGDRSASKGKPCLSLTGCGNTSDIRRPERPLQC